MHVVCVLNLQWEPGVGKVLNKIHYMHYTAYDGRVDNLCMLEQ